MSGWEKRKLGDLCKWGSGGTPKKSHSEYYSGDIKWAIIGDLNESVLYDTKNKITEEGLKNSSAKLIPKNTLLIGMYGSIGKTAITGCELSTNQAIAFAIPHENKLNVYYLKYFISYSVSELFKLSKGGTQKNISQEILKNFKIPLPKLQVQINIVEEIEKQLTRLTDSTETLLAMKTKLITYRNSVLSKAFKNELVQKRKKWSRESFGTMVIESRNGYTGRPNDEKKGAPRLGIETVTRSESIYLDESYCKYIDINEDLLERYGVKNGDILVCRQNGNKNYVGKFSIYDGKTKDLIFSDSLIRFTINTKMLLPEYVTYFMNSFLGRKELDEHCSTTAGNYSINGTNIKSVKVPIPDIDEQKEIVEEIESRLSVIDKLEEVINNSLKKAEILQKSILKSAFEGKLVKTDG
jgi:type I restriction enzyme S subunit